MALQQLFFKGDFLKTFIQHCFICRSLKSTVSEEARIEPRAVAILALAAYLLSMEKR
jgi:hypothetical protein